MKGIVWVLAVTMLVGVAGCGGGGGGGSYVAQSASAALTGSVSGRVLSSTGSPLSGATVETVPPTMTVVTDADGRFSLENIPMGTYEATARKEGSVCRLTLVVAGGGSTSATLAMAAPADGTVAAISGKVVDLNGTGVVGATVAVDGQTATTLTTTGGLFTLSGVQPGLVFLRVTSPSNAYLDGETRKALSVVAGGTLSGQQITLSGRPSSAATYVGMAACKTCHRNNMADKFAALDGSPTAAVHSRFVTEGTSHLVYKNMWPAPGGKLVPRSSSGAILKVQDPSDGVGLVYVVLCTRGDEPNRQYFFKFYPEDAGTLTEDQLDSSDSPSNAVWIEVAATIGGEGNWGEGYTDSGHQLPDRHPNFGEGKQRYMCRVQDVPYMQTWMAANNVSRVGQKQDYICYMPVFLMQDGTPVGSDALAPGEVGAPMFWQKSPDHWCTPDNTLSRNCAGCHSTGVRIETKDFLADPAHQYKSVVTNWDYDDLNVTCERCHGPGSEHFTGEGIDKTKLIMPQYLTTKAANESCGQCHANHDGRSISPSGIFKPAYDARYKDTVGHGFFVPGIYSLETFFANYNMVTSSASPDWKVGSFHTWPDQTHARPHSQELLDLRRSVHYNNSYQRLTCFDCHNPHTLDGGPASLKKGEYDFASAAYGNNTLCLACHAGSGPFTAVTTADVAVLQLDAGRQVKKGSTAVTVTTSNAALARNRIARAVAEHMQAGASMGGVVYTPDDPKMPVGNCASCHMPKIAKLHDLNVAAMYHLAKDMSGKSAVAEGNTASHVFDIVWPAQSALMRNPDETKGKDYDIMPNSCGKCHAFARISGDGR